MQFARSLPEEPNEQVLEAELLIALGRLLIAIKRQSDPDACDMFERAVGVCRRLKQPDLLARALFARGAIAMSRSELGPVEKISADLLHLADTTGSPAIRIAAEVRLGILRFHQGQLGAAKDNLTIALELCQQDKAAIPDLAITSSPDVAAAAYLANTLAHLGYPERAIAHAEFAIERARLLAWLRWHTLWRSPPRREHTRRSAMRPDAAIALRACLRCGRERLSTVSGTRRMPDGVADTRVAATSRMV